MKTETRDDATEVEGDDAKTPVVAIGAAALGVGVVFCIAVALAALAYVLAG